jgi:hypothetical protein
VPDLGKAVTFVMNQGNKIELARLGYLLADEKPVKEIVNMLFAGQRDDGGWVPFWASDYSSLDATCFRLAQAEQLGIASTETAIMRAIQFITQRQSEDGSWEEDREVIDLTPPWAKPGDTSARLYLTANCGYWLSILGNMPDRASAAAGYLLTQLDQDGRLPSFLHTHWLAGGLFFRLEWNESVERILAYLGSRIKDLPASNLAWILITLISAGISTNHSLVVNAAELLEQSQKDDGRWPSEDGPDYDVHSTLEAVRALYLCGRIEF